MAENPDYTFRDTPRSLIEEHERQLTSFSGYPEAEVAAAEERLGLAFPAVFRRYLLEMARSPGALFRGSDLAGVEDLDSFRANALALLAETDPELSLPAEAVVFQFHLYYRPGPYAERNLDSARQQFEDANLAMFEQIPAGHIEENYKESATASTRPPRRSRAPGWSRAT